MALIPIENIGQGGIITDVKPYQLQPNQWSNGNNVEFHAGAVSKLNGYKEVMNIPEGCPIEPWHLGTYQAHDNSDVFGSDEFYWLVFGLEKAYVYHGKAWYNITRQDGDGNDVNYNTKEGSDWDLTQSGALLIATNGKDVPQFWPLNDGQVNVSTRLIDMESWVDPLTNTPGETDLSCATVSGFKNHIVVTNIVRKNDNANVSEDLNRLVKWSTQHGHYAEPSTWDVTDPDQDAGEYELLDTQGPIVDTMPMGELFMVYKSDSVYMMSYIGTPYMFSFKTLEPNVGVVSKGGVTEFPGGHFFFSTSDCYVNNGQSVQPILTGKVRDAMYNNINGDHYNRVFCVTNHQYNEVWVCYPSATSDYCDKGLVWNYRENTFSFRDLPNVTDIKNGVQKYTELYKEDESTITWESSDPDPSIPLTPWRSMTTLTWGAVSYENVVSNMVMASPEGSKLYRDQIGQLNDGKLMYSYIERTGIDLGDPATIKHLRALWPKFQTRSDDPVFVYTGHQMSTDEAVKWEGPITFIPNLQSKVSVRTTGKLLAVRFETKSDTNWTLSGLEFEVEQGGRRGSRVYA